MINISNESIELIRSEVECESFKLLHFIKKFEVHNNVLNEYNVNIFCCSFKNAQELHENYKDVVNSIATNIQSNMSKQIEIYNIYILFFAEEVDYKIAYEIERDKYSSRKIVYLQKMPDNEEELKAIIENRLFYKHNNHVNYDNNNILENYDDILGLLKKLDLNKLSKDKKYWNDIKNDIKTKVSEQYEN